MVSFTNNNNIDNNSPQKERNRNDLPKESKWSRYQEHLLLCEEKIIQANQREERLEHLVHIYEEQLQKINRKINEKNYKSMKGN
jgi:hypothetical protein